MCMEDVRIGRATDSRMVTCSVGTGLTKVLSKNPRRFAVRISASTTQAMYWSNDGNIVATSGILIPAGGSGENITIKHDGDSARGDIWLAAPGGAVTVGAVETVFREEGMPPGK